MKSRFLKDKLANLVIILTALSFIAVACDESTGPRDTTAPPVPTGLTSDTGDGVVWLYWDPIIGIPDLDGYAVYRSTDNNRFYWQADVDANVTEYADDTVDNGLTYYYGVSSFDRAGNESDVSFDYVTVFDTPRPQGWDVVIYSYTETPYSDRSGFDFSMEERVPYTSTRADLFLEFDNDPAFYTYFLILGNNGGLIQDLGYTESIYDITYAPVNGWSAFNYVEAIEGHTYVIYTEDNHYAMIRITDFDDIPARSMTFDWAYQIDPGNRELKIGVPSDSLANPQMVNGAN